MNDVQETTAVEKGERTVKEMTSIDADSPEEEELVESGLERRDLEQEPHEGARKLSGERDMHCERGTLV